MNGLRHANLPSAYASFRKSLCPLLSLTPCISLCSQYYRMASTLPKLTIFQAVAKHDPASTAIIHSISNESFSYGTLLRDVVAAKKQISKTVCGSSLQGERIACFAEHSYNYVVTFLAILAHEAVALPLPHSIPANELRYLLEDSDAKLLLSTSKCATKAEEILTEGMRQKPLLRITDELGRESGGEEEDVHVDGPSSGRGGLMLYTSGTTSRPKGVILSTPVFTAQARSLIEAWKYTDADLLLHVLPLHHIHGAINALFTPLLAGSAVEFLFPFNASATWTRLANPFLPLPPSDSRRPITILTAVPTIYNRLLSSHSSLDADVQEAARRAIFPANLRLNISGSAALPTPTKTAWSNLSQGNALLERYGMTEAGMALSCGLDIADRVDGSVGWPLPSVEVRLVDADTNRTIPEGEELGPDGREREGEIQLRGPTIFSEYWKNPQATAAEFVDGSDNRGKWFKTGDIALRRTVHGAGNSQQTWAKGPMYFIQGRKSVDIIKSGGEKISALEIERELLSLPQVSEAAVVGIPSEQWGQKVAAVIVIDPRYCHSGKQGKRWGAMDMRRALRDRLAGYKIPQELRIVERMPRNAMGKINKKSLIREVFGESLSN